MKRISLSLFALAVTTVVWAQIDSQKFLAVEETTQGIGVHPCGDRHEAKLEFVTREAFSLAFESNIDPDLQVQMDSVAGEKRYSIVFVTQSREYDYTGRRLTIRVPGFRPYTMPLALQDKQKFEYTVSDPYSVLRSPYFIYMERGNEQFLAGEYQQAKDNYEIVKACPEYLVNKETVDEHLAKCDSMILWNAMAVEKEQFNKYLDAYHYYLKMSVENSSNHSIHERARSALDNFHADCNALMNMGRQNFDNGDLERAREYYERVVTNNCNQAAEAGNQISEIRKQINRRNTHARALFYEWQPNVPYGLTYAVCYTDRVSGYISFHFNSDFIKMAAQRSYDEGGEFTEEENPTPKQGTFAHSSMPHYLYNEDDWEISTKRNAVVPKELKYEAAMSFGWTCHVWLPIYVHWGIGYTGGGFDTPRDFNTALQKLKDELKDGDDLVSGWDKLSASNKHKAMETNWCNAVSPEAGIILKYWRFNLKFTYKYNFWIGYEDKYEDFFKDNSSKFSLGAGFCW